MTRIDPPFPLVTPKGKAMAHFVIDYGYEHDLMWVCFQDDSRECWTWRNSDVLLGDNLTARGKNSTTKEK